MRRIITASTAIGILALASTASSRAIRRRAPRPSPHKPTVAGRRSTCGPARRGFTGRRRPLDDAGQGLCFDALFGLNEITPANVGKLHGRLHLLDRHERGPGSGAARRRRHDVRGHALSEHRLRARPHQAGRAAEMEVRAQARARRARASPAATSVNRGAFYRDGKLFFNTLDGQTIAVDAATGKESGARSSATSTRARRSRWRRWSPKGKVLVGNSGGEMGVRGWLTALDASERQARLEGLSHRPRQGRADRPGLPARSTRSDQGKDLGVTTLAARSLEDRRRHGLGLDQLRSATSNSSTTAPAIPGPGTPSSARATTSGPPAFSRATSDTGQARWFYQCNAARPVRPRRHQRDRSCSTCRSAATVAPGARASGSQRLSSMCIDRAHRRSALGRRRTAT